MQGELGQLPRKTKKKITPWSLERVHAVIDGLPERFHGGGKLCFGCGLRQGEAAAPEDGMHAFRHAYASVLLDAGESVKALSEYLGHSDPGFTLRTYTHLMPSSEARTRRTIDEALAPAGARHGTHGTKEDHSGVCPECALTA